MIQQKFITLNSHTFFCETTNVRSWIKKLFIILRLFGFNKESVFFSFDDFYAREIDLIEDLVEIGVKNISIFYSPQLLGAEDMSNDLRNTSSGALKAGTLEELLYIKEKYSFIDIGLHGLCHEDYIYMNRYESRTFFCEQKKLHNNIFKDSNISFAFPYGKASCDSIKEAELHFDRVYLSDNEKNITTKDLDSITINRRHLEIGGSLFKLILVLLKDRLIRHPN